MNEFLSELCYNVLYLGYTGTSSSRWVSKPLADEFHSVTKSKGKIIYLFYLSIYPSIQLARLHIH